MPMKGSSCHCARSTSATGHVRLIGRSRCGSALTQYVVGVCANRIGTERTRPTDALPGVPGAAGLAVIAVILSFHNRTSGLCCPIAALAKGQLLGCRGRSRVGTSSDCDCRLIVSAVSP